MAHSFPSNASFGRNGEELFLSLKDEGVTPTFEDQRNLFFADSPRGRSIIRDAEQKIGRYQFGNTEFDGYNVRLFVSSDQDSIRTWESVLKPAPNELIVLFWNNEGLNIPFGSPFAFTATEGFAPEIGVGGRSIEEMFGADDHGFTLLAGEKVRTTIEHFKNYRHPSRDQRWFGALWSPLTDDRALNVFVETSALVGQGYDKALGVLSFITELNHSIYQSVITSLPNPFELMEQMEKIVSDNLYHMVDEALSSKVATQAFDFAEQGQAMISYVTSLVEEALDSIPTVEYLARSFWVRLNERYEYEEPPEGEYEFDPRDFEAAKREFEEQIYYTVASPENLKKIAGGMFEDLSKHSEELIVLAIAAPTIGLSYFILGTVWQIIYDIVSAIVMIAQLGYYAVGGIYSYLTAPEVNTEDWANMDEETMNSLFPSFDEEARTKFINEDLPKIIEDIRAFTRPLMADFIHQPRYYGQMVGDFIAENILANTVDGAFWLLTTPYPKNEGFFSKLWWVIKQYFNLGAMLGPIIVDIVLLFCSGGASGVFSGAAKLGKVDKVSDILRYTQRSVDAIKSASRYTQIIEMIPLRLRTKIFELFERLWMWVADIVEVIKDVFKFVNNKLPEAKRLPTENIDELARLFDKWNDRLQIAGLVAALGLLFFGPTTQINEEGKVALSE
jgi:hypothetical protein